MSSIHEVVVERSRVLNGETQHVPAEVVLGVVGGLVLAVHVVRALRVSEATARTWLGRRGLSPDPRSLATVEGYLRRLRWSRVLSAALLVGVCAAALSLGQVGVSFLSLPFLLSVVVAEALAPDPRRGRIRVAGLAPRSRSYFGPPRHIAVVRTAMVGASVASLAAAALVDHATAFLVSHGVVMAVGALAFEAALHRTAVRALPDRQPDLMVDTAMRVASARTATAAGLVFGAFGWVLSSAALASAVADGSRATAFALSGVAQLLLPLALAFAVALVQPLTSWRPRTAA